PAAGHDRAEHDFAALSQALRRPRRPEAHRGDSRRNQAPAPAPVRDHEGLLFLERYRPRLSCDAMHTACQSNRIAAARLPTSDASKLAATTNLEKLLLLCNSESNKV